MKNILIASAALLALSINGCGGSAPIVKSPNYTLGEQAGCETAKGNYTKNSDLFRSDPDYEQGWFAGRKNCNPSFHRE